MKKAPPRVVTPTFDIRGGRTWLEYPDFDNTNFADGVTDFLHGIVVFRDTSFDSDRRQWLERAGATLEEGVEARPDRIVVPRQVHSGKVRDVGTLEDDGEAVCDGLTTSLPRVMVGVTAADCVPLLAFDRRAGVVGAAHCGWRGIAAGIVGEFARALGAAIDGSSDTRYLIGPSIGACCYEVGDDMLAHFSDRDRSRHVNVRSGRAFFDLRAAVISRLMDRGVEAGQICVDNTCTSCQQCRLSSYRAGGRDCGRMLAFAMLTR